MRLTNLQCPDFKFDEGACPVFNFLVSIKMPLFVAEPCQAFTFNSDEHKCLQTGVISTSSRLSHNERKQSVTMSSAAM